MKQSVNNQVIYRGSQKYQHVDFFVNVVSNTGENETWKVKVNCWQLTTKSRKSLEFVYKLIICSIPCNAGRVITITTI